MEPVVQLAKERTQTGLTGIVPADALRGFFLIMDAWAVSAEDARVLLGSPAERTYYAWRRGTAVRVPADTLRRIGYVAGIYKALRILYPIRCWRTAGSDARTGRSVGKRRSSA